MREKNVVCVSNIPRGLDGLQENQMIENFTILANGVEFEWELQDDGIQIHLIF